MALEALKGWTAQQRHAVAAAYLGWTVDAFDFFLLIFVLKDAAAEFGQSIAVTTIAVTLTLAFRPLGAFIFGRLADHYGRRPTLILNIFIFSLLSFATAFAPNFAIFVIVRAAFGIGMGGVWGVGSALAMETIRPEARGMVSGLLQSGYSTGYLIASVVFGAFYVMVGWRGMFLIGIVPALLLIPYVYFKIHESPAFERSNRGAVSILSVLRRNWKLTVYAVILMTAFNFFSHGTQDLYPTFLQNQHSLGPSSVGTIAIIYNIGAVLGCFLFGSLSQHFGRRRMMIAAAFCALPSIWLWAYSSTVVLLTIGAFLINFFVQGCWSIIPAHLNELSPAAARSTFPGTVYQLGNLIAASNLTIQALIVEARGEYSLALASVTLGAGLAIMLLVKFGPEAHNADMSGTR